MDEAGGKKGRGKGAATYPWVTACGLPGVWFLKGVCGPLHHREIGDIVSRCCVLRLLLFCVGRPRVADMFVIPLSLPLLCCASCLAASSRAVLSFPVLGWAGLGWAGLGWAGLGCAVLCFACCAVLCCAVLCCAVLCCAVLCCAVLCCAVLCCACAVLCCAVLLYSVLSRPVMSRDVLSYLDVFNRSSPETTQSMCTSSRRGISKPKTYRYLCYTNSIPVLVVQQEYIIIDPEGDGGKGAAAGRV